MFNSLRSIYAWGNIRPFYDFHGCNVSYFFSSLILEFISFGLGLAGMKEGLSTSPLAKWCGFGKIGSAIIGLAIATSLLVWYTKFYFGGGNTIYI